MGKILKNVESVRVDEEADIFIDPVFAVVQELCANLESFSRETRPVSRVRTPSAPGYLNSNALSQQHSDRYHARIEEFLAEKGVTWENINNSPVAVTFLKNNPQSSEYFKLQLFKNRTPESNNRIKETLDSRGKEIFEAANALAAEATTLWAKARDNVINSGVMTNSINDKIPYEFLKSVDQFLAEKGVYLLDIHNTPPVLAFMKDARDNNVWHGNVALKTLTKALENKENLVARKDKYDAKVKKAMDFFRGDNLSDSDTKISSNDLTSIPSKKNIFRI